MTTWTTLYITGRPGFKEAVLDKLDNHNSFYLPGAVNSEEDLLLYWIDSTTSLREFKYKIGSKMLFKYRLRFSFSLPEENNNGLTLTAQEEALVKKMNAWEAQYLHSA